MRGLAIAAGLALASVAAQADEGMWLLDSLPVQQLQARYGFTPSKDWIERVQDASVRLARGCSGSFVSPNGLVMTNHHCASECLSQLSSADRPLLRDGFTAATREEEVRCPDIEVDQLQGVSDVTGAMNAATQGQTGAGYVATQRAASSRIEQDCVGGDADTWRCDVVNLYLGGKYSLYKYRRYQDLRLAFAPEDDIAFFGGDPDNFNFPRYDLDVAFLRVYDKGQPVHPTYLPFAPDGPKAGELVFTSGNPGSTSRAKTAAELVALRDTGLPRLGAYLENLDGVLWEYSRRGSEQARHAEEDLFWIENELKVVAGWRATLADPALIARKRADDAALRDWVNAAPDRRALYGDPWAAIAAAMRADAVIAPRYTMIEGEHGQILGFSSALFRRARRLVRAAAERAKPDAERLPEYRDANLPALQQELFADAPTYKQFDQTKLAWSLGKLRQVLGADDPLVRQVLGTTSPEETATRLVEGTKLADVADRHRLWDGGEAAITASTDPMVVLARDVDPAARAVRKRHDDEVQAVLDKSGEAIAHARFARDAGASYPDATFSPRLSYGTVEGWTEDDGRVVPSFTHFAGLYRRATGSDPFQLPPRWADMHGKLDLATPFNFVTTNDIVGGNSGSPVVDRDGRAVGLIFDGNIHSLGGDFAYDGRQNRAVAVDTAAILAALRDVYGQTALADELEGKAP